MKNTVSQFLVPLKNRIFYKQSIPKVRFFYGNIIFSLYFQHSSVFLSFHFPVDACDYENFLDDFDSLEDCEKYWNEALEDQQDDGRPRSAVLIYEYLHVMCFLLKQFPNPFFGVCALNRRSLRRTPCTN